MLKGLSHEGSHDFIMQNVYLLRLLAASVLAQWLQEFFYLLLEDPLN
jgi:hypothetical protein